MSSVSRRFTITSFANSSLRVWGWLLLMGLCAVPLAARAQDTPAKPDKTAPAAADLFNALDDIEGLRALYILKMTPEQIDKVIKIVDDAQSESRRKLEAVNQIVVKMADDILTTKRNALRGEAIPPEFDAKVKKAEAEFLKKRADARLQSIAALSAALQKTLTSEQIANAAQQDKQARIKLGKSTGEGTTIQWFNSYIVDTFIDVPRILPLLKEIKAARQVGTGLPNR